MDFGYFLARHRKHRSLWKSLPSVNTISTYVRTFVDKLQWRAYFLKAEAHDLKYNKDWVKRQYVRVKHKVTAQINVSGIDSIPALEAWPRRFRGHMTTAANHAIAKVYGGTR